MTGSQVVQPPLLQPKAAQASIIVQLSTNSGVGAMYLESARGQSNGAGRSEVYLLSLVHTYRY
jgi:hypothetical protein